MAQEEFPKFRMDGLGFDYIGVRLNGRSAERYEYEQDGDSEHRQHEPQKLHDVQNGSFS